MTTLHAVPVTTPVRTIFDLASASIHARVERALDFALSRRLTNNAELHHCSDYSHSEGAPASPPCASCWRSGPLTSASQTAASSDASAVSPGRRVPLQSQVDLADETGWLARVDFYYAPLRLVIEIDSVLYHSALTDRRHDGATTARLIAAGYTVLRFTEVEVFFEPDRVVAALRSAFWQSNVG